MMLESSVGEINGIGVSAVHTGRERAVRTWSMREGGADRSRENWEAKWRANEFVISWGFVIMVEDEVSFEIFVQDLENLRVSL